MNGEVVEPIEFVVGQNVHGQKVVQRGYMSGRQQVLGLELGNRAVTVTHFANRRVCPPTVCAQVHDGVLGLRLGGDAFELDDRRNARNSSNL